MQSEVMTHDVTTAVARRKPARPAIMRAPRVWPARTELLSHLAAIGLGATAMYLLDPDRGRQRRHQMRDRLAQATAALRAHGHFSSRNAALGLIGTALVMRRVTNVPFERLVRIGGSSRAVTVRTAITIAAPIDHVFNWLVAWERWPHWMSRVRTVRSQVGSGVVGERTHWVVDGRAGRTVEWDAETTRFVPPTLIAWRTVEGSSIAHEGTLTLSRTDTGATRLDVELTYMPMAGARRQALASLLRRDPRRQLDDDLARLKTTIETGRPPRDAAVPSRLAGADTVSR